MLGCWETELFEKYIFYLLLIPESDTSISSYLAALYAGNILLILGFTPETTLKHQTQILRSNGQMIMILTYTLSSSKDPYLHIRIFLH